MYRMRLGTSPPIRSRGGRGQARRYVSIPACTPGQVSGQIVRLPTPADRRPESASSPRPRQALARALRGRCVDAHRSPAVPTVKQLVPRTHLFLFHCFRRHSSYSAFDTATATLAASAAFASNKARFARNDLRSEELV